MIVCRWSDLNTSLVSRHNGATGWPMILGRLVCEGKSILCDLHFLSLFFIWNGYQKSAVESQLLYHTPIFIDLIACRYAQLISKQNCMILFHNIHGPILIKYFI